MASDPELLAAWREGDVRAGQELFGRYFEPVSRFFANKLHEDFGSLYRFNILAPFPRTEVRERPAHYGLEIQNSDWKENEPNHVVTGTPGADTAAIQAVSD